jgi:alanine dehydrogenase
LQIANKGLVEVIAKNEAIKLGVNVANKEITYEAVARDLGYNYVPVEKVFEKEFANMNSAT